MRDQRKIKHIRSNGRKDKHTMGAYKFERRDEMCRTGRMEEGGKKAFD